MFHSQVCWFWFNLIHSFYVHSRFCEAFVLWNLIRINGSFQVNQDLCQEREIKHQAWGRYKVANTECVGEKHLRLILATAARSIFRPNRKTPEDVYQDEVIWRNYNKNCSNIPLLTLLAIQKWCLDALSYMKIYTCRYMGVFVYDVTAKWLQGRRDKGISQTAADHGHMIHVWAGILKHEHSVHHKK